MTGKRSLFLWSGAALLATLGTSRVRADEKADDLLKAAEQTTKATRTLAADLSMSEQYISAGKEVTLKAAGTIKLKKPALARIDFTEGLFAKIILWDGKKLRTVLPNAQSQKPTAEAQGKDLDTMWAAPVRMFFGGQPAEIFGQGDKPETAYLGRRVVNGADYDVVQLRGKAQVAYVMELYIAPGKPITRIDAEITQGTRKAKWNIALNNVQMNSELADAAFIYPPPAVAKARSFPTLDDLNNKLLPVGSAAPRFALSTPAGSKISLADALKGKKAVLVNFWFYN